MNDCGPTLNDGCRCGAGLNYPMPKVEACNRTGRRWDQPYVRLDSNGRIVLDRQGRQ